MRNCWGISALLSQLNNNCLGVFPNVAKLLIYLYNTRMTKQQLTQLAGSQAELARLLNISRSAVCQWETVPELQLRRLKDLRPQWFTQEKTWKKHFWQFGLRHHQQWSGQLVQPIHTIQTGDMWLARPVVLEIIATQTVIELWFAKRLAALIVVGLHMKSAGTTPVRQHPKGWDFRCSPFFWANYANQELEEVSALQRPQTTLGKTLQGCFRRSWVVWIRPTC